MSTTVSPSPCPRCGNPIVERTNSTNGSRFLGCSDFPLCRFTQRPVQSPEAVTAGASPDPERSFIPFDPSDPDAFLDNEIGGNFGWRKGS